MRLTKYFISIYFYCCFATFAATPDLCAQAAFTAAQRHAVPLNLMHAISQIETSPDGQHAWPWTINDAGKSRWFPNQQEAHQYLAARIKSGARQLDIGCFQISFAWHGENFPSWETILSPQANADYAARYLTELYQQYGTWHAAAGAYHSRTPARAEAYVQKLAQQLQATAMPPPRTTGIKAAPSRLNRGLSRHLPQALPLSSRPPLLRSAP